MQKFRKETTKLNFLLNTKYFANSKVPIQSGKHRIQYEKSPTNAQNDQKPRKRQKHNNVLAIHIFSRKRKRHFFHKNTNNKNVNIKNAAKKNAFF